MEHGQIESPKSALVRFVQLFGIEGTAATKIVEDNLVSWEAENVRLRENYAPLGEVVDGLAEFFGYHKIITPIDPDPGPVKQWPDPKAVRGPGYGNDPGKPKHGSGLLTPIFMIESARKETSTR